MIKNNSLRLQTSCHAAETQHECLIVMINQLLKRCLIVLWLHITLSAKVIKSTSLFLQRFLPSRVSYPSSSPAYLLGRLSSSFLSSGLGSFSVSNIHYVLLDVWLRFSPSLLRKTSLTPSKKKESSVSSQMPPMWMGAQSPPLRYLPPPPPPLQPSLSMTDTPPLSLAHSSSSISFDQKKLHSVKSSAAFVRR